MTTTWGVYNLQGKLPDGTHVDGNDRRAVRWFVRWRVDGQARKRTFKAKGYAKTFRESLLRAQLMGWPADNRGWPIMQVEVNQHSSDAHTGPGPSFADYSSTVWYPINKGLWADKNRIGHRANMRLAIELLRYPPNDARIQPLDGVRAGDSILLNHLVADDVIRAVSARAMRNARTAAVNQRRIARLPGDVGTIDLVEERASKATVRAFYVTLAMIIRSATNSGLTRRNPLLGTTKFAPMPTQKRISSRIVPSIDEVFDLAEAIAQLGPMGADGRPTGERFRSLILCAGTLAPRPGELVAHRPEWIDWDAPTIVRFHKTEAAIYDTEEGVRGRQVRTLKHRGEDDWRAVPALSAVADALRLHFERGYHSPTRTWTSARGRAALDWHNLMTPYWRPACERIFARSSKPELATMTPSILRKAAITFWLDSGITPVLAADWAGHSEDVSKRYYAGRASTTFVKEAELLAASSGHSGQPSLGAGQ